MLDLSIFRVAGALARHSSARHDLIARNIANVDTPGYQARDIKPFDAVLAERNPNSSEVYRSMALSNAEPSPDGNTVSLETQMVMTAETQMKHEAALGIYRKSIDLLRLGLGRQ